MSVSAYGSQVSTSDPLELDLQVGMSCPVWVGFWELNLGLSYEWHAFLNCLATFPGSKCCRATFGDSPVWEDRCMNFIQFSRRDKSTESGKRYKNQHCVFISLGRGAAWLP